MDTEMSENRGAFPVDRPVEALLRDHNLFRKLADAFTRSQDEEVRKQAALQILLLLDSHTQLEESAFYPAVRDVDPAMIDHFLQEHQRTDDMLQPLRTAPLDDPQAEQLLRQVIDITLHHMQEEETQFFPKLQQAHLDMADIGLRMQAAEANFSHVEARTGQQGPRR
ncbi:hemerythrin domain-containing protein [Noviherbaspirillum agri]